MIDFSFLIKIFSLNEFKSLLWDHVKIAFTNSFNRTNDEFKWESEVNPDVVDYLKQRQFILCEKTLDNLHGDLRFQLLEGIKNRESITEIKSRLDKIFDTTHVNTERIARTEVINAFQEGEFHAQIQSGVAKYKVWKANVNNKRTAADSLRLHNQIQPIDKSFKDPKTGDEMMHSPNRPNCRCSIVYLFELPKNVIKKKGIMYLE